MITISLEVHQVASLVCLFTGLIITIALVAFEKGKKSV